MKMKKMILSAIVLLMALVCVGCVRNTEKIEPVNIAFVLGIQDDETKVNIGIDELAALPAQPGTDYAFISAEGKPKLIGEPDTIVDLSSRGYTEAMMNRIREGIKADLTEKFNAYVPSTEEIDMAGALSLSVRTLNAHAIAGRQNILVLYCGGKSTAGLINMLETPVYQMDIEASVQSIAEKMNLSMSGVDKVIWYCCGDFGTNQPELNSEEKTKIKEFYKQLFVALGMDPEHVTFKDNLPSAECYSFPETPVSAMEVAGVSSGLQEMVVFDAEIFEDASGNAFDTPIVIPEGQVNYIPNTSDFLDPEAAAEAFRPIAEYLLAHKEQGILIYSTCAGDTNSDYSLHLATERSEKIYEILKKAGIEPERITVVAVKNTDDPYYQFGLGTGQAASVNRKTVITDINSELAQQLLVLSY